jgi:hypothetical protein
VPETPLSESGGTGFTEVPHIAAGGTPFPQDAITPQPLRILPLPYERARALAMLPRSKWSEGTKAAFAGAIAALPSAIDALIHACGRKPFSLEAFETIQVLLFFGFLVWLVISFITSRIDQTSLEYLGALYPNPSHNE